MARVPTHLSTLLQELTAHLPVILGRNLVGIYLYGSLTQRSFNPKRSDVDCIVVTRQDLSDRQFRRLEDWLARTAESNHWGKRLQMSFLIKDKVLTMNSRACFYQFGVFRRSGSDGNPIIWMNVLKSGVVLYGPHPESFVPEISSEILFQALEREVGYLREEIIEKAHSEWRDVPAYRVYAVFTLCRILYSYRKGVIVSKQRAAKWAMKNLSEEWSPIILQALKGYDAEHWPKIALSGIKRFIAFADAQLHAVDAGKQGRKDAGKRLKEAGR